MADQETMLAQNLRDYIGIIRDTIGVEEKQLHLINLVCAFLGMSATDFQVETYSGQQFVLLANLVLEVKANLHWHQSNEELKTKLIPRWDVHLSGDDDQLGCAGESLSSVLGERSGTVV